MSGGHVGAWWPAGVTPVEPVPVEVAQTRDVVGAAGPRSHKEATKVLRYCWEYLEHRRAAGRSVDASEAFTAEAVEAYKEDLAGAAGSKDARCSYLRRLHPHVGLAGTTRTTQAATRTTQATTHPAPASGLVLAVSDSATPASETVAAMIAGHRPQLLAAPLWEVVGDLTRTVVAKVGVQRPERARLLMTDVAYVAAWVHSQHRPVTPETVLAGATIEAFLTLLSGVRNERGVATVAANLHAVREANGIGCDVERRRFPAAAAKAPYSPAELDEAYRRAGRIPQAGRRAYVRAGMALLLGAGAAPGECGWALTSAVVRKADGVWVGLGVPGEWRTRLDTDAESALATVERRWVQVLDDHADDVLVANEYATANDQPFLLGGTGLRRNDRLNRVLAGTSDHWTVQLDTTRARATWLVDAAVSGRYPVITDLLAAAGAVGLERLDAVLPDIAARASEVQESATFLASLNDVLARQANAA